MHNVYNRPTRLHHMKISCDGCREYEERERMCNSPSQGQEDSLNCAFARPAGEDGQSIVVDVSVRFDTGKVDLCEELDFGWPVWVIGAAVDAERVNAILIDRVSRSNDGCVPVGHHCCIP